jgi:hypothetical protein
LAEQRLIASVSLPLKLDQNRSDLGLQNARSERILASLTAQRKQAVIPLG